MNTPKIRFKGFKDDWEQRKLGDIVDVRSGKDYKHLSEGNIPVYGTGGYMLSVNQALSYDEDAIGIGRKGTIDKPYILKAPFWTVDTLFYAVPSQNSDLDFVFDIFQNIDWKKKDESTGVPSLSKTAINEIDISAPCLEEQQVIGSYFSKIDHLIALHQRKCDETKQLKKFMLQKMFPKNGEKNPELRFEGFTDDWEQRKVGDYYEFRNGLNKGKEFFGKGTPIVNFTDVFHNRGILSDNLNGKVQLEEKEIENFNVKKGDIFFTRTSETIDEIGYPSVMLDTPKNTVFSGFVLRGRCYLEEDPLDDLLKKYVFFTDAFRTEMLKKSSMTTRALTSGTAIKGMEFLHPSSKDEQHKIGEYFTTIDHLITLHQRKCEKLKELKNFMLQNMFV